MMRRMRRRAASLCDTYAASGDRDSVLPVRRYSIEQPRYSDRRYRSSTQGSRLSDRFSLIREYLIPVALHILESELVFRIASTLFQNTYPSNITEGYHMVRKIPHKMNTLC